MVYIVLWLLYAVVNDEVNDKVFNFLFVIQNPTKLSESVFKYCDRMDLQAPYLSGTPLAIPGSGTPSCTTMVNTYLAF